MRDPIHKENIKMSEELTFKDKMLSLKKDILEILKENNDVLPGVELFNKIQHLHDNEVFLRSALMQMLDQGMIHFGADMYIHTGNLWEKDLQHIKESIQNGEMITRNTEPKTLSPHDKLLDLKTHILDVLAEEKTGMLGTDLMEKMKEKYLNNEDAIIIALRQLLDSGFLDFDRLMHLAKKSY